MQQEEFVINRTSLQWLFALLVALDRPTHPDTDGNLRAVLRILCGKRAALSSVDDELAPDLNVLISVISRSFGQNMDNLN